MFGAILLTGAIHEQRLPQNLFELIYFLDELDLLAESDVVWSGWVRLGGNRLWAIEHPWAGRGGRLLGFNHTDFLSRVLKIDFGSDLDLT